DTPARGFVAPSLLVTRTSSFGRQVGALRFWFFVLWRRSLLEHGYAWNVRCTAHRTRNYGPRMTGGRPISLPTWSGGGGRRWWEAARSGSRSSTRRGS